MDRLDDVTGVVLAGGLGTRLGRDKTMLTLGDRPVIERVVTALSEVCAKVVVVSRTKTSEFLGLPVVTDIYPGCGPLGGIHAALSYAETPLVFVSACDMPFFAAGLVRLARSVWQGEDAVIPSVDGRIEPLQGLYHRRLATKAQEALAAGQLGVGRFLSQLDIRWLSPDEVATVGDPALLFFNINTVADYRRAEEIAREMAASAGTEGTPGRL